MKFSSVATLLLSGFVAQSEGRRFGHHVSNVMDELAGGKILTERDSTEYFYHDAVVDHYAQGLASTGKRWSQRFYFDDSHFGGKGSPVFMYIGGEGPQGPMSDKMFMYQMAEEVGALVVTLEHR